MQIIHHIEKFPSSSSPITLTIGNFDGVHHGHQAVLKSLSKERGQVVVFTFSNHPAEVLHQQPVANLTTITHRLKLLQQEGVQTTILTPFTHSFSQLSPEDFLTNLKRYIPFSKLVLGHDALIGHQRKGNAAVLYELAKKLHFDLEYLEPMQLNGIIVSSTHIRHLIQAGDLKSASQFLGRPFSIFSSIQPGAGKGRLIGFPTANISVEGLCLPPLGVYAIKTVIKDQIHFGVANLGHAPTLHASRPSLLEVHLFDWPAASPDSLDVIFLQHLRSEKRFESIDALKDQIQKDIKMAKSLI